MPEMTISDEKKTEDEIYDSSSFGLDMEDIKLDKMNIQNQKLQFRFQAKM
jgi:hypothetical protein